MLKKIDNDDAWVIRMEGLSRPMNAGHAPLACLPVSRHNPRLGLWFHVENLRLEMRRGKLKTLLMLNKIYVLSTQKANEN